MRGMRWHSSRYFYSCAFQHTTSFLRQKKSSKQLLTDRSIIVKMKKTDHAKNVGVEAGWLALARLKEANACFWTVGELKSAHENHGDTRR
jgi:hypothetical protein